VDRHVASRRRTLALLLALVVVVAALATPDGTLADQDPVAERVTITHRLDRERHRVTVTGRVRFTNRIPVQRIGNRVRRTYLEQWGPIAIAADATNLRVRGRGVRIRRVPTGGLYDNLIASFPRIFHGDSVSFSFSYTIPGRGASPSGTTVTDAYSRLCWVGQPVDAGTIELVLPASVEQVTRGSAVRTSRRGGQRRVTARVGDLATFSACTDVYDPRRLVRRDLVSPLGHDVRVEALPGHDAWLERTGEVVREAIAGVEAIVGAPLPGDDPIKVREVPSTALQGYAGDFEPGSGVIRVGEEGASVALLTHELAHAWFNDGTLSTNWLWEGLAEWASREAVGRPCHAPVEHPTGAPPRLGRWRILSSPASFEDQAIVAWQYEAACSIQGQVSAAMGQERMREVVSVLLSGTSPYDRLPDGGSRTLPEPSHPAASTQPTTAPVPTPIGGQHIGPVPRGATPAPPGTEPTPETASSPAPSPSTAPTARFSPTRSTARRTSPVDARQWLDVVDEIGLVAAGIEDLTFAEELLVANGVLRPRQLRGRAAARGAFHELQALAPGGVTPALVRRGLDDWRFEAARQDIRLAADVASRLAALPAETPGLTRLWSSYERAASRAALQRLRDDVP
jgi:hypothetical protein